MPLQKHFLYGVTPTMGAAAAALLLQPLAGTQVVQAKPSADATLHMARGEEKSRLHDSAAAIQEFNKAIKYRPDDPGLYEKRGWELFALKQFDKAEADFRRCLELDRSGRRGHAGLAMIFEARQMNREAELEADKGIAGFKKNTSLAPDQRWALSNLYAVKGNCQRAAKNYKQAEQSLLKAHELCPRNSLPLSTLGILYTDTADCYKAIAAYSKAIDLRQSRKQSTASLNLSRGTNYLTTGKNKEAVADFTRCINQDPRLEQALFLRAAALESLGDLKAARKDLEHLLKIAPDRLKYQKAWKRLKAKLNQINPYE